MHARRPRLAARPRRRLLGLAAAVLILPAALYAHTRLERSEPAADEVVTEPLEALRLVFSQGVEPSLTWAALIAPSGDTIALPRPEPVAGTDDAEYTVGVPSLREAGEYGVAWRTTAADGHVIAGSFTFTLAPSAIAQEEPPSIEPAAPAAPAPPPPPSGPFGERSILAVAARWLQFVGLIAAAGTVAFRLAVMPRGRVSTGAASHIEPALAAALGVAAALLLLALLGRLWLQAGAVFGTTGSLRAAAAAHYLTGTGWGRGWLTQAGGLVALIAAVGLARSRLEGWWLAAPAVVAIAAGLALSGHAAGDGNVLILATDAVHVLAAATWVGGLGALLLVAAPSTWRISTDGRAQRIAALVNAFSPVALAAAVTAALTGVLGATFHLSGVEQLWNTEWGRMLVLKVGLIAVAMGAGFFNWRFVRPGLVDDDGVRRLRGSAGLELVVGTVVLLATAVLVAMPTPD